jgi:hypothetical protein
MPVQNWLHGNPIRPKIVPTLQPLPELPEDSDLIGVGGSIEGPQTLDVLTASPDRIPSEFPMDSLCLRDESWIPYTPRVQMLLELDDVPMWHNFLATLSSWLLLGGFMVLPGTFASIHNSKAVKEGASRVGKVVLKAVDNIPLLVVGGVCCLIGVSSMLRLSWLWRRNYEWLLNQIIM